LDELNENLAADGEAAIYFIGGHCTTNAWSFHIRHVPINRQHVRRPELPERRVRIPCPGDDACVPVLHLERRLLRPPFIRHLSRLESRLQLTFFVAVKRQEHDELGGC